MTNGTHKVVKRWNAPKRAYPSAPVTFNPMPLHDLHGEEAERSIPPAVRGVVEMLRTKGHTVDVRRSARNGNWYYRVDGGKEVRGGRLCRQWEK